MKTTPSSCVFLLQFYKRHWKSYNLYAFNYTFRRICAIFTFSMLVDTLVYDLDSFHDTLPTSDSLFLRLENTALKIILCMAESVLKMHHKQNLNSRSRIIHSLFWHWQNASIHNLVLSYILQSGVGRGFSNIEIEYCFIFRLIFLSSLHLFPTL